MKHLLLTTIAAVLVVGCGEPQQSAPAPEVKPVEPVAGAKAPDISILDAVHKGNIEAVKQHLAAGADVEFDIYGLSVLDLAAGEGHKEIAELLIAEGADVNTKPGDEETTPLHLAAMNGHTEVAELLIAKGADVNAKCVDGKTPLYYAKGETVDLLRKYGGKTGEVQPEPLRQFALEISIHDAALFGDIEVIKQHLAAGTDVNAKGDNGWTPLHNAALDDNKEVAELLIAEGADVNVKRDNGETPLDEAISLDRTEIADLLRKHGGKTGEELKAEGK